MLIYWNAGVVSSKASIFERPTSYNLDHLIRRLWSWSLECIEGLEWCCSCIHCDEIVYYTVASLRLRVSSSLHQTFYDDPNMASVFPYTYYSCSCVDTTSSSAVPAIRQQLQDIDEEEGTFNPKSLRANFSLFPIEHLLYCTECHQVRCPRCITEEVVCWYCPGCLFEVPSSTVRSEGNR